ncbi:hypothetical protein AB0B79_38660 [Streptomyces sp. NPDC039022]|uniref:hypothetical protein n=1 Tax=unclassified Streptomyces TaxID=2593676 RepID=UPI0033DFCE0E
MSCQNPSLQESYAHLRSLTRLSGQVSHFQPLDRDCVERLRHEVLTAPAPWTTEYGEFQSGG